MADIYVIINGQQYLTTALDMSEADRYFRDDWTVVDGKVVVDMETAADTHRAVLRVLRNAELAKLDINYMKELETGADSSDTISAKNKLRDVPADPRIDAASTPEELKALTLEALIS